MPFQPIRLIGLRKAKGIRTQEELETICGIARSTLNKYETGSQEPSPDALETLAVKLEATMDYFHGLGDFYCDDEDGFATAARNMSFAVFSRAKRFTNQQKAWCRRTREHESAPRTLVGWQDLAEMIQLAFGRSRPSQSQKGRRPERFLEK